MKVYRCKGCGRPTPKNAFCSRCARNKDLTGGRTEMCANCKAWDHCQTKHENKFSVCVQCGKHDKCNSVRGGLCLGCYAKKWCAEHPLETAEFCEHLKVLTDNNGLEG